MSTRVPALPPPPAPAGARLRRVLQAGLDQRAATEPSHENRMITIETRTMNHSDSLVRLWEHERELEQKLEALTTSGQRTAPLSTLGRLHKLGLEIEAKRKAEPAGADPAAAAGDLDVDYQRMQSYYVCAQDGDPVLFVVKGWFTGDNRVGFDLMQRAAGLGLQLDTNNFYTLCGSGVSFEMSLQWYGEMFARMNAYAQTADTARLFPLPAAMRAHVTKAGNVGEQGFATEFDRLFRIEATREHRSAVQAQLGQYKYTDLRSGQLGPMVKHRVPAKPDSMVFFTGPHMVVGSAVRRLAIFVHSLSENTARDVLRDFPTYTAKVRAMQIPPNAQGKTRSALVDKYLKAEHGAWGWTQADNPGMPAELRSSLLVDESSIANAPLVAPPNADTVGRMRAAILADSCYVAEDVLTGAPPVGGVTLSAADFESFILGCLATVLDRALAEQERLRAQLLAWVQSYPGGAAALLARPDDPKTHEKELKARLKAKGMPTGELKDYAENVLLRGVRKPESASWERFRDRATAFRWPADPDTGSKKVLRAPEEALAELQPAPTMAPVADGPLARLNGDMANPKDLWQLVRNIGGIEASARLRARLYAEGRIAHPHIGAWVSAQKPWCPPLANPVGSWQNVYQILVLGMFDSHYMPSHVFLRHALKPIIEQMWHATSRKPFSKVLFAPERFNMRELPNGGSPMQWHIDQDAIAPACAMVFAAPEANVEPELGSDPDQDQEGAFLAETSHGEQSSYDPMDDVPLARRAEALQGA